MNFSVEIWKRSFQRFGLPDSRLAAAAAAKESGSDEEEEDTAGFQQLQEARAALEQRLRALETRLTYKEAQVLSLEEKLSASLRRIDEKEKQVDALVKENERKDQEWEEKRSAWTKKEEIFVGEIQGFVAELEDKCAALKGVTAEVRIEKDRSKALETTLREKIEELRCCKESRNASHLALVAYESQLQSLRKEMENQGFRLQEKVVENESLVKALGEKEMKVADLEEQDRNLREKNSKFLAKIEEAEKERQRLRSMLVASLAYNKEVMTMNAGEELQGANAKLESMVEELISVARENEEKFDASEWAVQQLGVVEVAKAKASLAQAEKDHVHLKTSVSELEKILKFREDELAEMETDVTSLRKQLRNVQGKVEMLEEKLQLAQDKYDGLKADHDAALSRIAGYEELKNNDVVIAHHDDNLKEIHLELQRTQLSTKDVMERMLSLHNSLLRDQDEQELQISSSEPIALEAPLLRQSPAIDEQAKICNKRGRNLDPNREDEDQKIASDDVITEGEPVLVLSKRQRQ